MDSAKSNIADLPKENMPDENNPRIIEDMAGDISDFLNTMDFSQATYTTYSYHLERFVRWSTALKIDLGNMPAAKLKNYLAAHRWKENTQRAAGNAVKSFLRWKYGISHPALNLRLPKDMAGRGRSLAVSQLERLLASFDTMRPVGWRNLAIIALMAETGIRESEICRLELNYLNLESRHFDVLAKRRKWREGVFSTLTASYLHIWLAARKDIAVKGCPYVFVSVNGKTKGKGLTPGGLRANFRKYGIRSGVGALSPHDLRRTMATLLTDNQAPTRLVQELGAWEDIRMVVRYTQNLDPDKIEEYSPIVKSMGLFK